MLRLPLPAAPQGLVVRGRRPNVRGALVSSRWRNSAAFEVGSLVRGRPGLLSPPSPSAERKEHEMTPGSIVPQADEERTHSTMMAWRVHEFGPPENMKFERVARPEPGPGEVLVKVEAAGVGPWDGWI